MTVDVSEWTKDMSKCCNGPIDLYLNLNVANGFLSCFAKELYFGATIFSFASPRLFACKHKVRGMLWPCNVLCGA